MSVRKLTANLLTALVIMSGLATVQAQEYVPVADPFQFDPDFRWFEPMTQMDFEDMKPKKRANHGWFATYDRLHLYGSRPELNDRNISETNLDSGWGHRYELGYMLPTTDKGWLFTYTDMNIGQFFTIETERLNRFADEEPANPQPPFGVENPIGDGNNFGFNRRLYFVQDTENVIDFDSYELNKTWRMEPYHYGGILEPMIGIRWSRIDDLNSRQNYTNSLDPTFATAIIGATDAERLTTESNATENEIISGQAGFRYTKFRDRFTFSGDFRVFTGASFQSSRSHQSEILTIYGGTGTGGVPDREIYTSTAPTYTSNEEFSLGFDVRGEIGYQLSRAVSLRGGFQFIDVASGVWRGGNDVGVRNSQVPGGDQSQNFVMFGGTFGITFNR